MFDFGWIRVSLTWFGKMIFWEDELPKEEEEIEVKEPEVNWDSSVAWD